MSTQHGFISSKILSGEQAHALPQYNLLSNDRHKRTYIQQYMSHKRLLCSQLQDCLIRILNGVSVDISLTAFDTESMNELNVSDKPMLWLKNSQSGRRNAFMAIDRTTLNTFSILFLGGNWNTKNQWDQTSDLTETECRLANQVCCQLTASFSKSLKRNDDFGSNCEIITNDMLSADGSWLRCVFSISVNEHTFNLYFWWPIEIDKPTDSVTTGTAPFLPLMPTIPVRLRIVLAEQNMPLDTISTLSVGDVVPLELAEPTPAFIGEKIYLHGRVAEQKGSLVYQITTTEPE